MKREAAKHPLPLGKREPASLDRARPVSFRAPKIVWSVGSRTRLVIFKVSSAASLQRQIYLSKRHLFLAVEFESRLLICYYILASFCRWIGNVALPSGLLPSRVIQEWRYFLKGHKLAECAFFLADLSICESIFQPVQLLFREEALRGEGPLISDKPGKGLITK